MSHDNSPLFESYRLGDMTLKNRMVMAPLTRSRAIGNVPNELMAEYYAQRASGGLIITEGTAPSPNGLGYARIPGIYNDAQIKGWKAVTDAVHKHDGRIFVQLMHVGRVGHPLNLPDGAELVAPSPIAPAGEMYTDEKGLQPYPTPREMGEKDIEAAINEYVQASKNATKAGFDGVELHAANGYLIDQFLNPASNTRQDKWGGSMENRNRFALTVAARTIEAIGPNRVGMRISPHGVFSSMAPFSEEEGQYFALAKALGKLGLVYLHVVNHEPMGAPPVPDAIKKGLRKAFGGTYILSGGYFDAQAATSDLQADSGDLVAFGRAFLANPDLPKRLEKGADLNEADHETFYTPGAKGYTDYPTLEKGH